MGILSIFEIIPSYLVDTFKYILLHQEKLQTKKGKMLLKKEACIFTFPDFFGGNLLRKNREPPESWEKEMFYGLALPVIKYSTSQGKLVSLKSRYKITSVSVFC